MVLKSWGPSQKTLRPTLCPKLATNLSDGCLAQAVAYAENFRGDQNFVTIV